MPLHLPATLLARIRDHGRAAYPHECCGLMLGVIDAAGWHVHAVEPADNAAGDRGRDRYDLPPETYLRADREARARGWDIVGIYHTHPDAAPHPSRTDLAEAWPAYVYLILRVDAGQPADAAAWTLGAAAFEPVELRISPSTHAGH